MRPRNTEPYPAWADAHLALKYINKGKARGNKKALSIRSEFQRRLGNLGKWAGRRGGLVILVGIVSLALLCLGISNVKLDTTLDSLWTPDSGRIHQELAYVTKLSGFTRDTNEHLIQTTKKDAHQSILNSKALLEHLDVLQRAIAVTVDLYDVTWSLKDICYQSNIPNFDSQVVDQIFEKLFPCVIYTPLDCFWEGSKLLGPSYPIHIPGFKGALKWTNLNPQVLLGRAMLIGQGDANIQSFPFDILEGFMKRGGIGSGYQEKPCLDPTDPECPVTAPNKGASTPPDVATTLAPGCYGFAPRFMHWAPDLIIGGQVHNKSGNLVKAGGLMSTVQIMSSSELLEFWKGTWRVQHFEWSETKAQSVIKTWQSRFSEEVSRLTLDDDRSNQFNFYSFTPAGLDSVVEFASQFSWSWGIARASGVTIATVFVGIVLSGTFEMWRVRIGLLIGGSLIALLGTAAGCGIAGFAKIPFNVATVQVLPYLTMALVSHVFFLLLHSQLHWRHDAKSTLKRHGFSILLGIVVSVLFIGAGILFPIPAVRSLACQGAIFLLVSSAAIFVLFPAVCQLVLRGYIMKAGAEPPGFIPGQMGSVGSRIACPLMPGIRTPSSGTQSVPLVSVGRNKLASISRSSLSNGGIKACNNNDTTSPCNNPHGDSNKSEAEGEEPTKNPSATRINWIECYLRVLHFKWFSGIVIIMYIVCLVVSGLGILKLRLGLPITDVVPSNSSEWEFLAAQGKLFPVYHIKTISKVNFDYPNNQKLIHKFHEAMSGLPWIIRDDNGGKPAMWLSSFRSWLLMLQGIFDKEWKLGYLNKEKWTKDASADGILAWKLAVQTGHVDQPVDLTQLPNNRLVDSEGIINPRAFYVYLTAWAWNDPLAYGATAANLKPETRTWVHLPEETELKIPKASPIKYAEISYILRTNSDDDGETNQESQILAFVREIRSICSVFESRGLPVFPSGIPFRFYEQYLNFPANSGIVIGTAAGAALIVIFCSLGLTLRPVGVVLVVTLVTTAQIAGIIGWLGVGLNALPVEIALLGVSLVLFTTIQILVNFCCIPGSLPTRLTVSFITVGPPCVQSLVLVSITALILYSPDFTFIFTHFTLLVSITAIIALANTLFLLPLTLLFFKPRCVLNGTYTDDPTFLEPLSPSPIPRRSSNRQSGRGSSCSRNSSRHSNPPPYSFRGSNSRSGGGSHSRGCTHARAPSENSLSTITEEPSSCGTRRSAEIVVQPQVVVETFERDGPSTKTKVSAKLKVEVHSSVHSGNTHQLYPQSSVNTSCNMSDNSGASSTNSSLSSTSSSASSTSSSYNERGRDD